jgi:2-polyprenyl-6-methoxyphenol hydroxylase-like FAD-dependent oxidoreductase
MAATKEITTKVAIVGAGPVGLLTSRLLAAYRVPHVLIERRTNARNHPQAHYLNMRTMEILRAHAWEAFYKSSLSSPPSTTWRYAQVIVLNLAIFVKLIALYSYYDYIMNIEILCIVTP